MPAWRSIRLEEIEPIPVVEGTLLWRPVRRTLGVGAFGINAYVAPNAGDDVVEEHTESTLRHEEVYVVLSGRATFTLDGETLDAPAGTVVFVEDPLVRRHARVWSPERRSLQSAGRATTPTSRHRGRTCSPPSRSAPPATTRPMQPLSRAPSSDDPTTRRRCTTSRAPRPSPAAPMPRSPIFAGPCLQCEKNDPVDEARARGGSVPDGHVGPGVSGHCIVRAQVSAR